MTPPAGGYTSSEALRAPPSPQGEGFFIGRNQAGAFPLRGRCCVRRTLLTNTAGGMGAGHCPALFFFPAQHYAVEVIKILDHLNLCEILFHKFGNSLSLIAADFKQ